MRAIRYAGGVSQHLLDRPVWHALATRLAPFATGDALAKRFLPDVNVFAAACDDDAVSLRSLAALVLESSAAVLIQAGESPIPPGTVEVAQTAGVQMVAERIEPLGPGGHVVELTAADAPAMLALATFTQPGPFLPRTHELGTFYGVKEDGRLLAMAGERMKLPGFTEVSGVCTHPDARGRGFAGELSRVVATQILARRETPFLHAYATNTTAIRLYEALGFRLRSEMQVTVLARG